MINFVDLSNLLAKVGQRGSESSGIALSKNEPVEAASFEATLRKLIALIEEGKSTTNLEASPASVLETKSGSVREIENDVRMNDEANPQEGELQDTEKPTEAQTVERSRAPASEAEHGKGPGSDRLESDFARSVHERNLVTAVRKFSETPVHARTSEAQPLNTADSTKAGDSGTSGPETSAKTQSAVREESTLIEVMTSEAPERIRRHSEKYERVVSGDGKGGQVSSNEPAEIRSSFDERSELSQSLKSRSTFVDAEVGDGRSVESWSGEMQGEKPLTKRPLVSGRYEGNQLGETLRNPESPTHETDARGLSPHSQKLTESLQRYAENTRDQHTVKNFDSITAQNDGAGRFDIEPDLTDSKFPVGLRRTVDSVGTQVGGAVYHAERSLSHVDHAAVQVPKNPKEVLSEDAAAGERPGLQRQRSGEIHPTQSWNETVVSTPGMNTSILKGSQRISHSGTEQAVRPDQTEVEAPFRKTRLEGWDIDQRSTPRTESNGAQRSPERGGETELLRRSTGPAHEDGRNSDFKSKRELAPGTPYTGSSVDWEVAASRRTLNSSKNEELTTTDRKHHTGEHRGADGGGELVELSEPKGSEVRPEALKTKSGQHTEVRRNDIQLTQTFKTHDGVNGNVVSNSDGQGRRTYSQHGVMEQGKALGYETNQSSAVHTVWKNSKRLVQNPLQERSDVVSFSRLGEEKAVSNGKEPFTAQRNSQVDQGESRSVTQRNVFGQNLTLPERTSEVSVIPEMNPSAFDSSEVKSSSHASPVVRGPGRTGGATRSELGTTALGSQRSQVDTPARLTEGVERNRTGGIRSVPENSQQDVSSFKRGDGTEAPDVRVVDGRGESRPLRGETDTVARGAQLAERGDLGSQRQYDVRGQDPASVERSGRANVFRGTDAGSFDFSDAKSSDRPNSPVRAPESTDVTLNPELRRYSGVRTEVGVQPSDGVKRAAKNEERRLSGSVNEGEGTIRPPVLRDESQHQSAKSPAAPRPKLVKDDSVSEPQVSSASLHRFTKGGETSPKVRFGNQPANVANPDSTITVVDRERIPLDSGKNNGNAGTVQELEALLSRADVKEINLKLDGRTAVNSGTDNFSNNKPAQPPQHRYAQEKEILNVELGGASQRVNTHENRVTSEVAKSPAGNPQERRGAGQGGPLLSEELERVGPESAQNERTETFGNQLDSKPSFPRSDQQESRTLLNITALAVSQTFTAQGTLSAVEGGMGRTEIVDGEREHTMLGALAEEVAIGKFLKLTETENREEWEEENREVEQGTESVGGGESEQRADGRVSTYVAVQKADYAEPNYPSNRTVQRWGEIPENIVFSDERSELVGRSDGASTGQRSGELPAKEGLRNGAEGPAKDIIELKNFKHSSEYINLQLGQDPAKGNAGEDTKPRVSEKFLERLAEQAYKFQGSAEPQGLGNSLNEVSPELAERLQFSKNLELIYQKIRDFLASNSLKETILMKLHPEHLGELEVELRRRGNVLQVTFATETDKAKELIERNSHVLREKLALLDFEVRSIETRVREEKFHEDERRHGQQRQDGGNQGWHQGREGERERQYEREDRWKRWVMNDDDEREGSV